MDAQLKKEQIGTLFIRVGTLSGGLEGWVVPQGGPGQKNLDEPSKNKSSLLADRIYIGDCFRIFLLKYTYSHVLLFLRLRMFFVRLVAVNPSG